MSTQQLLPLEPDLLTDWMSGPPPCKGWWNVRFRGVGSGDPFPFSDLNPMVLERRYWNGAQYSHPVAVGESDHVARRAQGRLSRFRAQCFEYQGLAQPPQEESQQQPQRRRLSV